MYFSKQYTQPHKFFSFNSYRVNRKVLLCYVTLCYVTIVRTKAPFVCGKLAPDRRDLLLQSLSAATMKARSPSVFFDDVKQGRCRNDFAGRSSPDEAALLTEIMGRKRQGYQPRIKLYRM